MPAVEIASMDDATRFGPEFHRLGFGEAVERGLLTDYKVLVLAVRATQSSTEFQQQFKNDDVELESRRRRQDRRAAGRPRKSGVEGLGRQRPLPMRRAVAFSRSIKDSQHVSALLNDNARHREQPRAPATTHSCSRPSTSTAR